MSETRLADQILDTGLQLAEKDTWENLHLHEIAETLGISLDQIREHYPQKDDLVEAWFDRADSAVLRAFPSPDIHKLSETERLHRVMMTWMEALSGHRRITREMLYYKLEPGHIHLQALGITRISRTVQWFREAALLESTNLQRILEEIGMTSIFLMTFMRWLNDQSPGSEKTHRFLDNLLKKAERMASVFGFS